MNIKRSTLALLLLFSLACNFITRGFSDPGTPAPQPPTPLVPAFIPPGCEAVPVATIPAATQLARPTPELQANPEVSTEVQLRVFEEAVDIIEAVYVYPDFN